VARYTEAREQRDLQILVRHRHQLVRMRTRIHKVCSRWRSPMGALLLILDWRLLRIIKRLLAEKTGSRWKTRFGSGSHVPCAKTNLAESLLLHGFKPRVQIRWVGV
jgi:hypothetical protein